MSKITRKTFAGIYNIGGCNFTCYEYDIYELLDSLNEWINFKKSVDKANSITEEYISKLGNVKTALKDGYKIKGLECFGIYSINSADSSLETIDKNLQMIITIIDSKIVSLKDAILSKITKLTYAVGKWNNSDRVKIDGYPICVAASLDCVKQATAVIYGSYMTQYDSRYN